MVIRCGEGHGGHSPPYCWRSLRLEVEADFDLAVDEGRDGEGLDGRGSGDDALFPRRDAVFAVVALDILPVGGNKVAKPVVEVADAEMVKQRQTEAGGFV